MAAQNDGSMKLTRDDYELVRKELARELALRRAVYPRFIKEGKVSQVLADDRIRWMQQAYDVLVNHHCPVEEKRK